MSHRHRPRLCLLALALVALLGWPARAQDRAELENKEQEFLFDRNNPVEITGFLGQWAKDLDCAIVFDQTVKGIRLNFLSTKTKLTWGMTKKILDFHDIVIEEKEGSPGSNRWVLFVHQRRNIGTKLPPPFRYVDLKKDQLPKREEVVTAVIQIVHGAGNDIYATVRGLLTRDINRIGNILYVRGPEVFIIVDFASNVEYYVKIIKALDVPAPGQEVRIKTLTYAPAQELAQLLSSILRATAGAGGAGPVPMPVVAGGGAAGQPQVIPDPRTNKIVIQAFPYQFDEIDRLIGELDVAVKQKLGRFHVYKCRDTDANYLSGKVRELFTGQGGGTTPRRSGGAGGARPTPGAGSPAVNLNPAGGPGAGQQTDVNRVETRIVADELTNSLLIQADEETYRQILSLLQQLDSRRRVVAIEAQVWEVSTPTDQLTLGVELAAVNNAHQGSFRGSGVTNFGLSTIQVDPQKQTITRLPNIAQGAIGVLTKDSFDKLPVIIDAVASFSKAKLVTRPFTVTNDNEEATFALSNSVPFLTSNLSGSGIAQQNVQNVEAKSELKITPQVNGDDNLTLTVTITLSSFGAQPSPNLPPPTNSRTYNGTVTIPNQKFVVFGGLEQDTETVTETKVPFVGDIPLLGHLFKNWQRNRTKNQVYVFIRPTIFADKKAHEAASTEIRERAHVIAERDEWVPAIIGDVKNAHRSAQDQAFETFGTGSGNPFGEAPKDE